MAGRSLIIMAAGMGSRYGGLKQMDPMGPSGEFIIDYSVFDAIRAGFDRIVFLISSRIEEDFKATVGTRIARHVKVDYVRQELTAIPDGFSLPPERKKPWGTAHAVLCCADVVRDPFGVINADDFYGRDSYEQLARFLGETAADSALYAMVGFTLRNTISDFGSVARGICTARPDGTLGAILERTKIEKTADGVSFLDEQGRRHPLTGNEVASMNMWGFKPSLFEAAREQFRDFLRESGADPKAEFFIPTVVNTLLQQDRVRTAILPTSSHWFGVTYQEEKPRVVARIRELVQRGEYPERLWT